VITRRRFVSCFARRRFLLLAVASISVSLVFSSVNAVANGVIEFQMELFVSR
jgi:hypothetical protein